MVHLMSERCLVSPSVSEMSRFRVLGLVAIVIVKYLDQ